MKKGLVLLLIVFCCILAAALSNAESSIDCEYDEEYDLDSDYIMSKEADCPKGYQYDCDDDNKDVFKNCEEDIKEEKKESWWARLKAWFKNREAKQKQSAIITSNAVKKLIPDEDTFKELKEKVTRVKEDEVIDSECHAVICMEDLTEVYCQDDYDDCCDKYDDCRVIYCSQEECEAEETYTYEVEYDDEDTDPCYEEYNDCYDDGEAVICKGPFEDCASSFDDCVCGTYDDVDSRGEQLEADFDNSAPVDCDTGVYICERQVITMSGDIADSTVTCKSSWSECSMIYGNCQCGNSTLTDFPTQRIGSTDIDSGSANADSFWCDYKGKRIPCYMLPDNCTKKKNTCLNDNERWITCSGSFDFCEKMYDECLCGIEIISSGFMVTSAD